MINFVSTFPPIMCGIATYTKYLVSQMPSDSWRVTSFAPDRPFRLAETFGLSDQVSYRISLTESTLPFPLREKVIWFQHTFGIWGKDPLCFLRFVEDAKKRNKKVVASFHTIHFQCPETEFGLRKKEEDLLNEALPLLDALTVFTKGAHRAVIRTFPQYQDRVLVLRHGVHLYPPIRQEEAKKKLLKYLINEPDIPSQKKKDLEKAYAHFFSPKTVILGNFGFVAAGKALSDLYRLRELVQQKLPQYRILSLVIGRVRLEKDTKIEKNSATLQELRSFHDGEKNLFFEHYLCEEIFPVAFKALDFGVFWCQGGTQSGRMSHAQGVEACVIGRKIEGIGETLELSGLPGGQTLEELAEVVQRFTLHPELKKEVQMSSRHYAQQYSFAVQARKHLLLAKSLLTNQNLPPLDTVPSRKVPHTGRCEIGQIGRIQASFKGCSRANNGD